MKATATPLPRTLAGTTALLLAAQLTLAQTTPPAQPPAAALAQPATADGTPFTLQSAVAYALEHNLTVRQSQLNAELSDVTQRAGRGALLPTANLSGSQTWNYGTGLDPLTNDFVSQTIRSNNFSAFSQITLFSGFQLRNTVKRNSLDYQAALIDIEQARNDLSLNVASVYLQLVLSEELIRANQTRVNSSQQQIERTQKLLKAGAVAESNLLDSRAQLASDELTVVTAQNQRDIARLQLIQLLNLDAAGAASFRIDLPQLADPDDEAEYAAEPGAIFETAQGLMPEIKAADLRVRSGQLGVDVARGAYLPRLTFGAGVFTGFSSSRLARVFNGDSTSAIPIPVVQYVNGQPVPTTFAVLQPKQAIPDLLPAKFSDQIKDNLGRQLQFNLTIPILNGFQARTNVQRAQVTARQAELRAEQTRLTLRQNIQQAAADALAAQRRFTSSKRQVEALTLAYRNAEIRFNNGLLNGTEFNIAKNNLAAAESTMIQAKYEFIFRSKVLDFYQGRPLAL
ncbi:TolC family protein [Hymenobacter psychrotolerans]|uniref:Outer membrane protein n=1 Tax=Hymenobacter psychrotolerans DSM 18569 TaxID=1121959 RepID=A0A1M7G9U7_9BACT|nr:TolC family protein [Hymenobacter psychrotolerans]SHM12697.1 outer membrane protein [Hymenobacter psychrotolerans DSM 18569]